MNHDMDRDSTNANLEEAIGLEQAGASAAGQVEHAEEQGEHAVLPSEST